MNSGLGLGVRRTVYVALLLRVGVVPLLSQTSGHDYAVDIRLAAELSRQGKSSETVALLEACLRNAERNRERSWLSLLLNNLGAAYQRLGKYAQAEEMYSRSIRGWTDLRGADAVELAAPLNNLGSLYFEAGQYARSEKLRERSLKINETALGVNHPLVANVLSNLAFVYYAEHKYEQAEATARRALDIWSKIQALDRAGEADSVTVIGMVCAQTGRPEDAEAYLQQAVKMWQSLMGASHPRVATSMARLAMFYAYRLQYAEALDLFEQVLPILRTSETPAASRVLVLVSYARMLRTMGRVGKAKELEKEAKGLKASEAQAALSRDFLDVSARLRR